MMCFMSLRSSIDKENGGCPSKGRSNSIRHSRAGGNPGDGQLPSYRRRPVSRGGGAGLTWIPAFAGMTEGWKSHLGLDHLFTLIFERARRFRRIQVPNFESFAFFAANSPNPNCPYFVTFVIFVVNSLSFTAPGSFSFSPAPPAACS